MNRNFLRYIPYAGLAASLVGIVLSVRKPKKMLICSPMMDDGLAAPIMDYAKKHPGVEITEELGSKILKEVSK